MNAPFKNPARQEYISATLQDLIEGKVEGAGGPGHVSVARCLPGAALEVAPVTFGMRAEPEFACVQHPPGWNPGTIITDPVDVFTVRNAIVHGESGLVTTGNILIRDTVKLPSYADNDIRWMPGGVMSMPKNEPSLRLRSGAHIFCGYPGTRNYSHFLMDIISAALVPPLNNAYANATPIISPLFYPYQRDYLNYFPELFYRALFVSGHTQIFCDEIKISSFSCRNEHHAPHPYHADVMRMLRDRMLARHPELSVDLPRKIYVSRLDSAARPLLNEADVIACAEAHGFTSLSMSGRSVAEQAALFANATHIITPHGAGATNVIFCRPGTKFLELLTDNYVQWSMRRIGSLAPMIYGCVIGHEEGSAEMTWKRKWTIDIPQVDAAIQEMLA